MTIYVYPEMFEPPSVASGDDVIPWDGEGQLLEKLLPYPKEVEIKPVVPREWDRGRLFCQMVGEANLNRIYSQMALERNMLPGLKNLLNTVKKANYINSMEPVIEAFSGFKRAYIVGAGPSASKFDQSKVDIQSEFIISAHNSPVRFTDILCVCDVAPVPIKAEKALWYVATPTASIDYDFANTKVAGNAIYPGQDSPILHDAFCSVMNHQPQPAILSNVGSMMLNIACSMPSVVEVECFGLDLCVHSLDEASVRWGASTVEVTMEDGTVVYTNPDFLSASKAWGEYHKTYPRVKFLTHSKVLPIDGFTYCDN